MKNKMIKLIFCVTILLIFIDQMTKFVIQYKYENPIGNGFIRITLVQNTGMAFGFNSGNMKNMILTFVILLLIVNFIRTQKEMIDTKTSVALGFILAGGISNLIDRIMRGGVMDFIQVKNFAVLNLADCYVVIGWILIVIFLVKFNQGIVGGRRCEKQ